MEGIKDLVALIWEIRVLMVEEKGGDWELRCERVLRAKVRRSG